MAGLWRTKATLSGEDVTGASERLHQPATKATTHTCCTYCINISLLFPGDCLSFLVRGRLWPDALLAEAGEHPGHGPAEVAGLLARAVDSFNASARAVTEASQSLKDTSLAAQESFLLRSGTKRVEAEKKAAAAKAAAEQAKSKAAGQPASPPSKSEGLFKRLFGPGDATAVPP